MSCLWENSRTRPSALFLQSAHLRRRRDLDRLLPWPAYCPPARRHHAQRAFLIGHIVAHRFSGVKLSLILSLIALIPACLDGGMACTLQIRAPVGPLAAARLGAAGRPRAFARRCASTPPREMPGPTLADGVAAPVEHFVTQFPPRLPDKVPSVASFLPSRAISFTQSNDHAIRAFPYFSNSRLNASRIRSCCVIPHSAEIRRRNVSAVFFNPFVRPLYFATLS